MPRKSKSQIYRSKAQTVLYIAKSTDMIHTENFMKLPRVTDRKYVASK